MKKSVWKQPDGEGGFEKVYHETSADMVKHSDTNVAQILDDLPTISDFMASLLSTSNAKSARKILSVNKEYIFDECNSHWYGGKNPPLSTYHAKFNKAAQFDGTFFIVTPADSLIDLGGRDFAIECFFVPEVLTLQAVFGLCDSNSKYVALHILDGGYLRLGESISGSWQFDSLTTPLTAGQMYHALLNYYNENLHLFLDGVEVATLPINISRRGFRLSCASIPGYSTFFNGAISELRFSEGSARHYENFSPPTSPFLLDDFTVSLLHFD